MAPNDRDAAEESLERLRGEIDRIDRTLVELLAERRRVVGRVAEHKRRQGLPVYHPAREEDLISRRRDQARAAGLDPDLVEDVFRSIVRASRVVQAKGLRAPGVRQGARVLVVGGRGAMGTRIVEWFSAAGYPTEVLERDEWDRAARKARGADLAVLAVPIRATAEVAARLAPHLPEGCVLADLASLKTDPVRAMLRAHPGPVLGLHPMFGPTTQSLDKQVVVATPARFAARSEWVLEQLSAWGAVVVRSTPEEHDEIMGVVQALRHFATFVFGRFLSRSGVDLDRTLEVSSPIYRLELGMVGRLFAQDPDLYADIMLATPERRRLLRRFLDEAAETARFLDDENGREELIREFRRVAEWFGPFGDQAIRESSYLIEKLVERF